MMAKYISRIVTQMEVEVSIKNTAENFQFVHNKAITSLLLNVITQNKYWRFSLQVLDKVHSSLYEGPRDFMFMYMGVHEISFLSTWDSTSFYVYVYGSPRDFLFMIMVVHEV